MYGVMALNHDLHGGRHTNGDAASETGRRSRAHVTRRMTTPWFARQLTSWLTYLRYCPTRALLELATAACALWLASVLIPYGLQTLGMVLNSTHMHPEAAASLPLSKQRPGAPVTQIDIATLLNRPLFSEGRHPELVGEPAFLPRITGTLVSDAARIAIFSNGPGGKATAVPEGGHIGAYTVQSVANGQVSLLLQDNVQVLHLQSDYNTNTRLPPGILTAIPSDPPQRGQVYKGPTVRHTPCRNRNCLQTGDEQ